MPTASLADAQQALLRYVPTTVTMRENYTLDRMRRLLSALGEPQNAYRAIHIAGTSGKTSTAYFLRGLLERAGRRTGLTVSPHITALTERVQVAGHPLPEDVFVRRLDQFLAEVDGSGIEPTYFEVLVAFAYTVFAESELDYAVVETGVGGRLDGTNTIDRPDKLCVISDIGLDHTEVLGETLEEIAYEKAGIIRTGNRVIMLEQDPVAMEVVERAAKAVDARLRIVASTGPAPEELPEYQRRNWRLAAAAFEALAEHDPTLGPVQPAAASALTPPGRLDRRVVAGRTVTFDGAHNPQKVRALRLSLEEQGVRRCAVVATFLRAPEHKLVAALHELRPLVSHLIVPDLSVVQDINKVAPPATEVADRARSIGYPSVEVQSDPRRALAALVARPEEHLLVTGSLYLVGEMLALAG